MNVQWEGVFVAVRVWKALRLSAPPATEDAIRQTLMANTPVRD